MEETLNVTPEELQTTSSSFSEKATQVKSLHDAMLNTARNIDWDGKAAETYKTEFTSLQSKMDALYEEIMKYSTKLSKIAENFLNAEEQNVLTSNMS